MILEQEKLVEVIEKMGITIDSRTSSNIIAFCPYHPNDDTGAFSVSMELDNHPFKCFNPSCSRVGNIYSLFRDFNGMANRDDVDVYLQVGMFTSSPDELEEKLKTIMSKTKEEKYKIKSKSELERLNFEEENLAYLIGRGLNLDTIRYFGIGYENEQICIPVYDDREHFVGFTRRSISSESKSKYFDKDLPKKHLLFNIHNAKEYEEVIMVEGPLDAMKIHQAGFPNVVSVMGGSFSDEKANLVKKYWKRAILFLDNDNAGRALRNEIIEKLTDSYTTCYVVRYPVPVKDPDLLTEEQIRQTIENKRSVLELRLENKLGGVK